MEKHKTILFLVICVMIAFSTITNAQTKQNGIAYVTYGVGFYSTEDADTSLSYIAATSANWISLLATGYQETVRDTTIYLEEFSPTDEDLIHVINVAHKFDLKVMLKPHVDLKNDPEHWRGEIGNFFTTEAEWDAWFSSYQNFIFHYAELAETYGADQFCVGTELLGTSHREDDWRAVIGGVRDRYSGPITYASNPGEEIAISWWDAVDYIGVDAYYNLTEKNDPTVDELKAAWTPHLNLLDSLQSDWSKPILFTEIGYCSMDGANKFPWNYDITATNDLQEQADCYQAAFETFYTTSWFAGFYWWAWGTDPFEGDSCDMNFTPHNKPAEDILRFWFGAPPRPFPEEITIDSSWIMNIYTDEIGQNWEYWSWEANYNQSATDNVFKGNYSISATLNPWGALCFSVEPPFESKANDWLEFYINGSSLVETHLWVYVSTEAEFALRKRPVDNCRYIESGTIDSMTWKRVLIPLKHLKAENQSLINLCFQERKGQPSTSFWIDEIRVLGYRPQPPQIVSAGSATAYEDSFFTYTARAIDPEDSVVTYAFHHYPGWLTPIDSTISGIPREGAKDTSFMVIASDGELSDTLKVAVTVIPINDPPQIINLSDFTFVNNQSYIINLDTCVTDPDHLPKSLFWQITGFDTNLTIILDNRIATFTAPNWSGTANVQLKVTDPDGASDSMLVNVTVNLPSSVSDLAKHKPKNFILNQNYSNPFNSQTTISFGLPKPTEVTISIFNLNGQLVLELINGRERAGYHSLIWDASDISAGMYIIRMIAGDFVQSRKCVVLK